MDKILKNINIVLTRAKNQSIETISQLENLGANVLSLPTIKICTIVDNHELDDTIRDISRYIFFIKFFLKPMQM